MHTAAVWPRRLQWLLLRPQAEGCSPLTQGMMYHQHDGHLGSGLVEVGNMNAILEWTAMMAILTPRTRLPLPQSRLGSE